MCGRERSSQSARTGTEGGAAPSRGRGSTSDGAVVMRDPGRTHRIARRFRQSRRGEGPTQVADMQAVGGRVETAVEGDFLFVQQHAQSFNVGGLRDQSARLQILDKGGSHNRFFANNWMDWEIFSPAET